jgi:acylphosphatase
MPCKRLVITGRVQGVCYRDSLRRKADSLGVSGWTRNRRDGSVEALVCGDAAQLEAIIRWARRGPDMAEVDDVRVSEADGDCDGFRIVATE